MPAGLGRGNSETFGRMGAESGAPRTTKLNGFWCQFRRNSPTCQATKKARGRTQLSELGLLGYAARSARSHDLGTTFSNAPLDTVQRCEEVSTSGGPISTKIF